MRRLGLLIMAALCLAMCACGKTTAPQDGNKELSVVAATFPEYDWARNIIGDSEGIRLELLIDSGVDPHSFQPSAADIIKISDCDVFIYVGGESDKWMRDVLSEAKNKSMTTVCLMDALGVDARTEELTEGMQAEEHGDEQAEDGHEAEYDEHIWLSLKNAEILCGAIAGALETADPDNAEQYAANAEAYCAELNSLDGEYTQTVAASTHRTLIFADRFPFRYLMDDYGLEYYAAFPGCSAETEAAFETVTFLSGKTEELGLDCIITIDGSKGNIAEAVSAGTQGAELETLTLDSLQSVSAADIEGGVTYLSAMRENLSVLARALG